MNVRGYAGSSPLSERGYVLSVIRVFQKHRETFLPKFRICPYGKPILLSSEVTVKVQIWGGVQFIIQLNHGGKSRCEG